MEAVNLAVGLAVIMKLLAEGRQVVRSSDPLIVKLSDSTRVLWILAF
jgi:hypothetical protein